MDTGDIYEDYEFDGISLEGQKRNAMTMDERLKLIKDLHAQMQETELQLMVQKTNLEMARGRVLAYDYAEQVEQKLGRIFDENV